LNSCWTRAASFVIVFVALSAGQVSGQSVLHFPRVISKPGLFTGIAIGNPTSETVPVTYTAYTPQGERLSGPGITNPVTVLLSPGSQYARLFPELFGASGEFNGWVQVASSVTGLTGFFLNGNTSATDLDGAATVKSAAEFVLPLAQEDGTAKTEVTILNVNVEPVTATITLHALDGRILASKDVSLPIRSLIRQTLTELFPAVDLTRASHLRVRSSRPLIGHEVAADLLVSGSAIRRETIALSGQPTSSSTKYILPEFATGGGWLSLIGIVNAGGLPQEVTLTAYKDDGTLWSLPANPKKISLEPNAALRMTVQELFDLPADTLSTGWIEIGSQLGFVSSYIAYGDTARQSFGAVAATDASLAASHAVFSQVAEGSGFYTGLTLVNPSQENATVDFYTLRADGTTVGRSTFTIKPRERRGNLFSELLPASLEQVGGWALLRSTRPVIGAVLFGTTGNALANVPAQVPSDFNFDPPAQTSSAISGSIRSVRGPLANVQIALSGPVNVTRTTDAFGRYIFSQLPPGDYRIVPNFPGAVFAPSAQTIAVGRQNADGIDFEGDGLAQADSPVIEFVTPSSAFADSNRSLNLRLLGRSFTATSFIKINDEPWPTAFISPGELQASISASRLTKPGTLKISVETPPPGGGFSPAVDFAILPKPLDPLIQGRAPVGEFPAGVAIDTTHNTVLVTNQSSDNVTVLDLATQTATTRIRVGRSPAEGIAISKTRNLAVVANPGSNNVSVIDLSTNEVVKQIPVGRFPVGVAINANTNRALITNVDDDTVSILDLASLTVVGQIPVGLRPLNIAVHPRGNLAVVTNSGADTAQIIDLNTNAILASVRVGQFPRGVAIHPGLNLAVVANANSNDVSIIDLSTRTVVSTIKVATGPTGVAIHEKTNTALITNSGVVRGSTDYSVAGNVFVIDLMTKSVSRTIPVGSAAFGLDVDEDNQRAVVANFGNNDVTLIRVPNPRPRIEYLSPKTFPIGASLTLNVHGSGFVPTSWITLNKETVPTVFVSPTDLIAEIGGALLDRAVQMSPTQSDDSKPRFELNIGVTNPEPGGGDSLPPDDPSTTQILPQNLMPVLYSISPIEALSTGSATLTLNGNNFNASSIINFGETQYRPASSKSTELIVTIPASALTSPRTIPISVTNPEPGGGTSEKAQFKIHNSGNPVPGIISVKPASIPAGSGATIVVVEGAGFIPAAEAFLEKVKGTISGNTATFSLPADKTENPGTLDGIISNQPPGGGSAGFTVNIVNGMPSISSFSPNKVLAGSSSTNIRVSGADFRPDSKVTLDGTPISTQFVSATVLNATIPESLLRDAREVRVGVINAPPGGGSAEGGTLNIFKGNPNPTINSLAPSTVFGNRGPQTITIHGSGFIPESTVRVDESAVPSSYQDPQTILFTLPAVTRASVAVRVVNPEPGGGTSSASNLTITFVAPHISSLSPATATAGTQIQLIVYGSDFADGGVINFGGSPLATTFTSSTELSGSVSLPAPDTVPVTVINPSGLKSNSLNFVIAAPPATPAPPIIKPARPTLSEVLPDFSIIGTSTDVTLNGSNFISGNTNVIVSGSGVTVDTITVVNPGKLTARFTTEASAPLGPRNVTVKTDGGSSEARTFNVQLPPPVVTNILPNVGTPGSEVVVTVLGSNFVPGQTMVTISGSGITVSSALNSSTLHYSSTSTGFKATVPDSSTSLSLLVDIDSAAEPGTRFVTLTTPNGTAGGLTFTVSSPEFEGSISPRRGTVGNVVPASITGRNFVPGVTKIMTAAGGVTVGDIKVSTSTDLTTTITLDSNAEVGDQLLTVQTNEFKTLVNFGVTPAEPPTFTLVSPTVAVVGTTVTLTLTGTNFMPYGTSVKVTGSGVTLGSVIVDGTTSLTTPLTIDPAAPIGTRLVTITTPAGTSTSQILTLISPSPGKPTLSALSLDKANIGTLANLTLTGTNFVPEGTALSVSGTDVTIGPLKVVDSTTLTTTLTINRNAALGIRQISVATASGPSNEKPFTIMSPTSTTITSSVTAGQPVTFTATVAALNNSVPTGKVTFTVGSTTLCSAIPLNNGSAACTTSSIPNSAGLQTITAAYVPNSVNYTPSAGTIAHAVNRTNLTVIGITANNKVYDRSKSATLNMASAALVGVAGGDTVTLNTTGATAEFADKTVGNGKNVSVSGLTLEGANAANYVLTPPVFTGNITPKTLAVGGVTAANKSYDGNSAATLNVNSAVLVGVIPGDTVNLTTSAASGTFTDKAVGTGKTVTVSGLTIDGTDAENYALAQPNTTANITPKELTVSGIIGNGKVYDGSAAATLNTTSAVLNGVIPSDTVSLQAAAAVANFAGKNVGTNKNVTVSGLAITGPDAANYSLTQPNGIVADITAKSLAVNGLTAQNKTYDGTAAATLNFANATLAGIVIPDSVTFDGSSYTAAFNDKNAGIGKPVTVTGIVLGGADSGNYTVAQPNSLSAAISRANAEIGVSPYNVTYDGAAHTAAGSATGVNAESLTGLDLGATTHTNAGAYSDHWTFTDTTGNYNNTSGTVSNTIGKATPAVTAFGGSFIYDSTSKSGSGTALATDGAVLAPVTLTYTGTSNANTAPVNAGEYTTTAHFAGDGNYNPADSTPVTIHIDRRAANVAADAKSKNYGTPNPVLSTTVTGLLNGDTLNYSLATAADTNSNVGSYPITVTLAANPNYNVTKTDSTLRVNPALLTVTANDAAKVYGQTVIFSGKEFSVTGLVNGNSVTDVTLSSPGAAAAAGVGSYAIVPVNAVGSGLTNYSIKYVNGSLAVGPLNLTITANNGTKTFGSALTFAGTEFSASGLVNGDTVRSVALASAGAASTATVGRYDIVPSAAEGSGVTNYAINYLVGTLNITKYAFNVCDAAANCVGGRLTISVDQAIGTATVTLSPATVGGIDALSADNGVPPKFKVWIAPANDPTHPVLLGTGNAAKTAPIDGTASWTATITAPLDSTIGSGSYKAYVFGSNGAALTNNAVVDNDGYSKTDPANFTYPTLTADLAVSRSTQTITFGPLANKTYGDPDFTISATASSGLPINFATLGECILLGNSVHITGTDSCSITARQFGNAQYEAAPEVTRTFAIAKADASVRVTGYTGVYDGAAHGATGSVIGVKGEDLTGLLHLGSSFTNVPGGTAHWTFEGGRDYNNASGDVAITITARPLTPVVTIEDKLYDGTPDATISARSLSGVLPSDDGKVVLSGGAAAFNNRNAGPIKSVAVTGLSLSGPAAGNYSSSSTAASSAAIGAKPITVTAAGDRKIYDGTSNSTALPAVSPGLAGSDTPGFSQRFDNKNFGTNKTLTPSGTVNDGNSGSNYAVTFVSNKTGVIDKTSLTITATTNTKVYDGNASAAAIPTVSGTKTSDTVTGLTEQYDSKSAGTGKTLSIASYTITDGNNGNNYNVTTVVNTSGVITKGDSTTTVTSGPNSAMYGQIVTFTATVSGNGGPPTGTVTFKDGAATMGTATLTNGQATFTNSNLAAGSHAVTAIYGGDDNFNGSTSPALTIMTETFRP
jgi:YVTN family beta-propeller protein